MIFSSLPVYLDALNWQQQLLQENFGTENYDHHQLLPPLYPKDHHVDGVAAGSIRPGTMSDRARQAKIPLREAGLKCPRCESTNTKFCYFNNYSLSQPRHFCKTCRRYWTRGGALRNVPVGGGCRRNKNTKKNCSKSAAVNDGQTISNTNDTENTAASGSCTSELICPLLQPDLMASIQNINSRYGIGNLGLNSGDEKESHTDPFGRVSLKALCGGGVDQQWRSQRFHLLTSALESTSVASYPFQSGCVEASSAVALTSNNPLGILSSSSITRVITDQLPPVKFEDNHALSFPRSSTHGLYENHNQYWGGENSSTWTEIPALSTSSASHFL